VPDALRKPELVAALREAGYTGPVSYDWFTLNEMLGEAKEKGGSNVTPGWRGERGENQKPKVKKPKAAATPKERKGGTWELVTGIELLAVQQDAETMAYYLNGEGEARVEVRPRFDGESETMTIAGYEKWVPTPKPVKVKAEKGTGIQEGPFDPRQMLRIFENVELRNETGGYDVTHCSIQDIESSLAASRVAKSSNAEVTLPGGKTVVVDAVWLDSLLSIKRRLKNREEPQPPADQPV